MVVSNKLIYRKLPTLLCLFSLLFFSGCGFHLRGQFFLPSFLVKPYIYGSNLELIHRLEEAGGQFQGEIKVAEEMVEFSLPKALR